MLTVKGLTKKYADQVILHSLNLEIQFGEFVSIVGGSGSGKSTLLRCLALWERWDAGKFIHDGQELPPTWATRWKLGKIFTYMHSSHLLLPQQTAFRNVLSGRYRHFSFWRMLLGGKASEDEYMRAMDYLEKVGLLDQASQKVNTLSGGEAQRVAIARALCQGAKVLLIDDPISNLDPHSGEQVMRALQRLHQENQTTIILSTQNLDLAERFSSRLIGLSGGHVALDISGRRLTVAEKQRI
jgi:phosphonate transport system ATP-binding protein